MAVADVISTTMGFLFKFGLISSFLTASLHLPPPPPLPLPSPSHMSTYKRNLGHTLNSTLNPTEAHM